MGYSLCPFMVPPPPTLFPALHFCPFMVPPPSIVSAPSQFPPCSCTWRLPTAAAISCVRRQVANAPLPTLAGRFDDIMGRGVHGNTSWGFPADKWTVRSEAACRVPHLVPPRAPFQQQLQ